MLCNCQLMIERFNARQRNRLFMLTYYMKA